MEMHLEIKPVGKGAKGRTACGSSAYRACDCVMDNAGRVHDYSRKGGYVSGGIELPEGASEDLRNRQVLWSRHEKRDIRKDAELFREVIVALPNELDKEAAERVMKGICAELTKLGMCAQWDIHKGVSYEDPEGNKVSKRHRKKDVEYTEVQNLHGHLMLTMRELLPDGTFGKKNRAWNRYNGGLNMADLLRPVAAQLMNDELARINVEKRVEHESYAARGIDKIPQKHIGVEAMAMERRGIETVNGKRNRYIDWLNKIHAENLREAEQKTKRRLDALVAHAENIKAGVESFRDWDALFALLRDVRRSRAALVGENRRLDKIVAAYEDGDEKYLRWVGVDPNSAAQRLALKHLQEDNHAIMKMLDVAEETILDSKDLFKAHNRAVYKARQAEWDEYQIDRKKQGIAYCQKRMRTLTGYIDHLQQEISLLDTLFNTAEYQAYAKKINELKAERVRMANEKKQLRDEVRQHKLDLKEHKKEAKEAKREKKKIETDAR